MVMVPLLSVSIAAKSSACTNSFLDTLPSLLKSIAAQRLCTCASVTAGFSLFIAARSSSMVMVPLLSVSILLNFVSTSAAGADVDVPGVGRGRPLSTVCGKELPSLVFGVRWPTGSIFLNGL